MRIKFTKDFEVALSSTDSKVYPAGWSGDPGDDIAAAALKAKAAEMIVDDAAGEQPEPAATEKVAAPKKKRPSPAK